VCIQLKQKEGKVKLILRKQIILLGMTGLFVLVSLNAHAMMGGRGSSGARGYSYDSHMGDHTGGSGHGAGSLEKGGRYNRRHIQYPHEPGNTYYVPGSGMNHSSGNINREMAEQMIHGYMRKYHSGSYKIGGMRDGDSFIIAEVIKTDGSLIQWILINKRSGDIRSMR
jgi:hypothetical protein